MKSDSQIRNVRTIGTFRIRPFFFTEKPIKASARITQTLFEWMSKHNLPKPHPEDSPSPAALALFSLLSAKHRHLTFDVRPTSPNILVTLSAILPNTIPAELHPGDANLRTILWHVTRFNMNDSLPFASCGFQCDSSCLPSTDKKAFHLSQVFKSTTNHPTPRKRPRRPDCLFLNLPDDVLLKVVFFLNPKDYRALSKAHPYLEDFLRAIVPGLKLRLFPHQLYALSRMLEMEKPRRQPFPLLEEISSGGLEYGRIMADLVNGSLLLLDEVPRVKLPTGGLFCDEPGLGKTITALSLVLKTVGQTPQPPSGHEARPFTASNEREVFAYNEYHINRLSSYGRSSTDFASRDARLLPGIKKPLKRRLTRRVRLPDYFTSTKGLGSVPVVEESHNIFLSSATLIAVPPVLVPHWHSQIEQHVHTGTIKVLYITKQKNFPDTALELASYDVVLVSFEVLGEIYEDLRNGAHLLLQVHFFRLIVDEGHKLSASSVNNFISVCDRLRADVRWVMTGTPTPATPRCDIENLRDLLKFVKDEAYGLDEEAWAKGVKTPYSNYKKESLERLSTLMSQIMIRADKSILDAKCHVKNVFLKFSKETADSYNGLVRMARRNLITADWFDATHRESLLNSKKLADARAVMLNLRKACCFGGSMDVGFNTSDVAETLDELYEKFREKAGIHEDERFKDPIMENRLLENSFGGDEVDQKRKEDIQRRTDLYNSFDPRPIRLWKVKPHGPRKEMKSLMRMAYAGKLQKIGTALLTCDCLCARCDTHTKYPLITPCGHLLCDECVTLNKSACAVSTCGVGYKMDDKDVPEDLIELQPSIQSHEWRNDWAETTSSKMSYLMKRIESLPKNEDWRPNEATPHMIPPKVIVHSQHGDHLKLVAMHMKRSEKLRDAYVEMVINTRDIHQDARNNKTASEYAASGVKKFAEDPSAHVLLMNSRHGAVGLDLSFVQYIFLLEPLWDAADELQIVSRAHRIGCKRDIFVERLVMKKSVEEDIIADLQLSVNRLEDSTLLRVQDKTEKVYRKISTILRNLRVIRNDSIAPERNGEVILEGENIFGQGDWNATEEDGHSSDSVPGSSEMDSSESCPPSITAIPVPRGVLKRRRPEREPSAEPRRVRFRE